VPSIMLPASVTRWQLVLETPDDDTLWRALCEPERVVVLLLGLDRLGSRAW